jgi:mycothiol maleylpyruvate isomerase-like protein
MTDPALPDALGALDTIYGQITTLASELSEADLMRRSRCAGWAVADVLYHQLLDARRALRAFATPANRPPDRDYISYWREYAPDGGVPPGGGDSAAHARFVRIVSSAYSPGALAWEWTETAAAACLAGRACPHEAVATQGFSLSVAGFTATLVVEAAVHYLDMTVDLSAAPAPATEPLRLVREVLAGLAGAPLPDGWDDVTAALRGTGRERLAASDLDQLGPLAGRFPLFG